MPSVDIALWRVDSAVMPNGTPQSKLKALGDQVRAAFDSKPLPDLRIFMVAEFYFMNADRGQGGIRWYSKADKDAVVSGLLGMSKDHGGVLIVGGSVCWADCTTRRTLSKRTIWNVYNEAPVTYKGQLLAMHRKHFGGGEAGASDNLRLFEARRGAIDRTVTVRKDDNLDGTARYEQITETKPLDELSALHTTMIKKGTELAAPAFKEAFDRYDNRIRFTGGTGSGAFHLSDLNLAGGVEICQDHNLSVLKKSVPNPCDLHLLTSNTVSYAPASVHLAKNGLFVHCDPQNKPLAVINNGSLSAIDDTQWDQSRGALAVVNVRH